MLPEDMTTFWSMHTEHRGMSTKYTRVLLHIITLFTRRPTISWSLHTAEHRGMCTKYSIVLLHIIIVLPEDPLPPGHYIQQNTEVCVLSIV